MKKIVILSSSPSTERCYIYNGQSERENIKPPEPPSPFFLQKNTGNDERQIMTSKEVVSLALFA